MSLSLMLLVLAQAPEPIPPKEPPAQAPEAAHAFEVDDAHGAPAPPVGKAPKLPPGGQIPAPSTLVGRPAERVPITPDGRVNRTPSPNNQDVGRLQRRLQDLPPSEMASGAMDAVDALKRGAPSMIGGKEAFKREERQSPLMGRPEAEQVRYFARAWFQALIAGDARLATSMCAIPFQYEERTLRTPEDVRAEWLKTLRSRRADLIELYDLEVLTPAEMEKKYGKPPARLAALQWRAPRTYVVVGNLSGRAAVVVFRGSNGGFGWEAVGYHD